MEYAGRDLEAMDFAEQYHAWILNEFRPFLAGRVAEVGAGTGSFTELLLGVPVVSEVLAVEPSREMHALLAERLAGEPRVRTEQAIFRDVHAAGFDAAVYVNVLEHIEDDAEELRLVREALRPGGHVCIFVPALPWLYSELDATLGHFRRYTRPELEAKVRAAGLEVVHSRYFDVAGVLPWLVVYRLLRRPMVRGQVETYDRFVVPLMRHLEAFVRPPIGKNVLLVARRP